MNKALLPLRLRDIGDIRPTHYTLLPLLLQLLCRAITSCSSSCG